QSANTATSGADCTSPSDFVGVFQNVNFAAGETQMMVGVMTCDDTDIEGSEIFFTNVSGTQFQGNLGTIIQQTVTIVDNDAVSSGAISGRVVTAGGRGIYNARIVVRDPGNNVVAVSASSTFGYFLVNVLPGGVSYTVTVEAKRNTFAMPSQMVFVNGNVSGINFTAQQ
ncbi:MAG: carboxypeptidase-like regulatory domain-containing protein, partial [Pyrinomonadaceae bacterium]